jgi:hypothetical protein
MALSEFELRRFKKVLDEIRPPPNIRDKLDSGYRPDGLHKTPSPQVTAKTAMHLPPSHRV